MHFCWVPAHRGVEVNKKEDNVAKRALKASRDEIIKIPFGKGEAKSLIRKAGRDSWQKRWDTDGKGRL